MGENAFIRFPKPLERVFGPSGLDCVSKQNKSQNAKLYKFEQHTNKRKFVQNKNTFYKAKVRQSVMNLFSKGSTRVRVYNKAPYISGYVSDDI